KRELECPPTYAGCGNVGSAAGDPAVIDEDRDGYFDFIYIGTTGGMIFKVDLTAPNAVGLVPQREAFTVNTDQLVLIDSAGGFTRFSDTDFADLPPADEIDQPKRVIPDPMDPTDDPWRPFLIFDSLGSPIYHAPAAFFIPERNQYGLAIGTGDREDLWDEANGEAVTPPAGGRFFVIIDERFEYDEDLYDTTLTETCGPDPTDPNIPPLIPGRLPITQACIKNIDSLVDPADDELFGGVDSVNYLLNPDADPDLMAGDPDRRPGWVLTLTSTGRVTTEAFLVSGLVIFSAFDPEILVISPGSCQQSGTTRAFVVSIQNAGPVAPFGGGDPSDSDYGKRATDRYQEIEEFTTAPFVDSTATKNPDVQGDTLLDQIDEDLAAAVRKALIGQYPRGSRFNKAFSLVIAALRNSTGVDVYTTVPIAMYPADWKDQ
ncbi:MAG: hypothetical protein GY778_27850, partial [bacterium]|nr:hypothetical protein [bacterium]